MGLFDRARDLLRSPADRRLIAEAREAWGSAPAPMPAAEVAARMDAAPIAPGGQPANPPIDYRREQPPPPPVRYVLTPGYGDHVYQSMSAPLAFDGWTLDRIRTAISAHRLGFFLESSTLMVSILSFAPVLAALQQAIAPILALPRHVHGGDRGLARTVADEVREMLVPNHGLRPSPYLQPTMWGTMAIHLRMLGFCVLQHIDGEPDPDTGLRKRYTRIWSPWAVVRYRTPRKTIAMTTEGPVEVLNDGKFTLVEDEEEGHLAAAICALGEEVAGAKVTTAARLRWLDRFGDPKIVAFPPKGVATHGQPGDQFFACVEEIAGPEGRGVLPNGADIKSIAISGEGAGAFDSAMLDGIIRVFMVLTGSAGTIGNGANQGGGETYQPTKGGVWTVRHDLIARPTLAIVRALNQGHVAPFCDLNYAEAIERAKRAGVWTYPALEIPLPAPDRDERIESEVTRYKALAEQVKAEREAGGVVDQDRVNTLAAALEVKPFTLATDAPRVGDVYEYDIVNKIVAPDEVRARKGLPPLPKDAGTVERLADERLAGADKAGTLAKEQAADETTAQRPPADEPGSAP